MRVRRSAIAAERRAAPQRNSSASIPRMQSLKTMYDRGHGRGRAGRRLSAARSLALPLHGDLADGRPRSLRAHRLARTLSRRRAASQRQPLQCRRRLAGAARGADCRAHRRSGDRESSAATAWPATSKRRPRGASTPSRATAAFRSRRRISGSSRRSKTTRSAARKNCPSSSPAIRPTRPTRPTNSGAASRSPPRSSAANSGTRVIYVEQASYDTHAAQKGTQDRLLARALRCARGLLRRSRRARQRQARPDDDFSRVRAARRRKCAAAEPITAKPSRCFLLGGGVKGGIYGKYPSLTQLDNGDLTTPPTSAASMRPSSSAGSAARARAFWPGPSRSWPWCNLAAVGAPPGSAASWAASFLSVVAR